jgi:hypothetical protein
LPGIKSPFADEIPPQHDFISWEIKMDQSPETPSIQRPGYARRKRLLWIGFSVFSLLALFVLAGLLYVRTGRLNRYISSQVVEALSEYGLRAEIGNFNIAWGFQTAKIGPLRRLP